MARVYTAGRWGKHGRARRRGAAANGAAPPVSIVMPTYNGLHFLPFTVESILAQTFTSWELIVADDGSNAETRKYLARLERHERVRVLRLAHAGNPGRARNAAIAQARGRWIAFMDSDDLWLPAKLERQLAALRAAPECHWSYTAFVIVDANGSRLPSEAGRAWTAHRGRIFEEVVRGAASIRTPSVVVSKELVRAVGGFDEAIDCAEDYDLWARLALRSPACLVDEPLVHVRRHRTVETRTVGHAHVARDYSLRKLAAYVGAPQRALLKEERRRNALTRAAMIAAHGEGGRALGALAGSLPLGWNSARWWYGAAKVVARAALRARLPQA